MLNRTVAAGSGSRKAFELFIVPPCPHQSAGTSSTTQAHATATDGAKGEGGMTKCCVCGQATDKRCQACAKSGIDLFFCSPEHQKLVWKYHKQVCGPSAHSFRSPPLPPEEVYLLRSNAHEVIDLTEYKDEPAIAVLPEKVMTAETYVESSSFGNKGDFEHYQFGKKLPHALCILFALLAARQEQGVDAVPPAWIYQALENVADCYADIQPFPSESEAVAALGSLADLIMPIQQVRLVGVKDRQTGKISVKCVR